MKGYLSSILIFAAMLAVLSAFALVQANERNLSKSIAIEMADDLSLQYKQLIFEATSQGLARGLEISMATGEKDVLKIRENIRQSIREMLSPLANYANEDTQLVAWCGYVNNYDLQNLRERMLDGKAVLICDGCNKIDSEMCKGFISISNDFSVSFFAQSTDPDRFGVIGISSYNKKYGISSVSYIPTSAEVSVIK